MGSGIINSTVGHFASSLLAVLKNGREVKDSEASDHERDGEQMDSIRIAPLG
jgi:hypothetical protein